MKLQTVEEKELLMGTQKVTTAIVRSGGEMSLWREYARSKGRKTIFFFKEGTISKAEVFWKKFGAKSL